MQGVILFTARGRAIGSNPEGYAASNCIARVRIGGVGTHSIQSFSCNTDLYPSESRSPRLINTGLIGAPR